MTSKTPARFITLEGGEGAGKSTQARLLSQRLTEHGISNIVTREPGGSPGAEDIRKLLVEGEPGRWTPLVETLLMFAARADHVERAIRPALGAGQWVICDRFTDSTYAYQGAGSGVAPETIRALDATAVGGLRPDLTLVLDAPVEAAMQRIHARDHAEDRFEKFDNAFHERLRGYFCDLAKREPQRCALIDGTQLLQAVSEQVWRTVSERFSL